MSIHKIKDKIYGGDNMVNLSDVRYLPRWLVLGFDIVILYFAAYISFYFFEILNINTGAAISSFTKFFLILLINVIFMYVFKTYSGIIRHSTFIDLFKILLANLLTSASLILLNIIVNATMSINLFLPTFLFIYFTISVTMLFMFRLVVKEVFHVARELRKSSLKKRILVLGIDEQAIAVARAIMDNTLLHYSVVGFLTQRTDSKSAKLLGKPIYFRSKFETEQKIDIDIDGILLIEEMMSKEEMNSWVTLFLEKNLEIFKSPPLQKLKDNDIKKSIKSLQIEDLLNRKPIKIENDEIKKRHFDKAILVTGGAGSIGSEIVRQVAQFNPSVVVVLDQAETPLYEIELEMKKMFPAITFKFVLADISNKHRVETLFKKYKFSMVYHAAAYKHVPLVEENPHEGILVNTFGTKNLANLSSEYGVNRFVMVSTDKAVNPTNVMGATKRAAELYVQALQNVEGNKTKFITTRFGNVLGSNGSVIPYFKKQIENGGPVTITHPEIMRYFMTIPEACELVLQAGTMGKGGEIFVFDMGEPVKILDLAKRMIKLSGLNPDVDIKIVYTGLRPGEKLYEELLSDDTKTLPTPHEKIMISKDPCMDFEDIECLVKNVTKAAIRRNKLEVVTVLKQIVPEFKSNNSIFEALDK